MKKLNELKDDQMLIVYDTNDGVLLTKKDFLDEIKEHKNATVFTAVGHQLRFDAEDMLERAVDLSADYMYDGWADNVLFTEDEIAKLQAVLDEILDSPSNVMYMAKERVWGW